MGERALPFGRRASRAARISVFVSGDGLRELVGAGGVVPALMPLSVSPISSMSFPSTSRAIPCRFPPQPPMNLTLWILFCSSTSKMIWREQVPFVLYVEHDRYLKKLVYKIFIYDGIDVRSLQFPFFIDILCRLAVGHDKFQLQHGLSRGEDAQEYGVSAVFVLIIVRFALLAVAVPRAVVFDEDGNFFARALRNIDIKNLPDSCARPA